MICFVNVFVKNRGGLVPLWLSDVMAVFWHLPSRRSAFMSIAGEIVIEMIGMRAQPSSKPGIHTRWRTWIAISERALLDHRKAI